MQLPGRIETERLVIRQLQPEDLPHFIAFMLDEMATEHLAFTEEQKTEEGAKKVFQDVLDSYQSKRPVIALAIAEKQSGQFIGSCGISPLPEDGAFECYYSLLPKCWGMGFATEATRALLEFYLQTEGVKVIRAYVSPDNPRSIHVAQHLGMELVGEETHPYTGLEGLLYEVAS